MSNQAGRQGRAERAARMRAEQHAAERRRRQLWISGGVAIALVVIVAASIGIYRSTSSVTATASHAPAHTTSDYGYVVEAASPEAADADADAEAPRVVAYEDFLCPYCAQFESESGAWLLKQAQAGAIVLEYRPIAFLDQNSTTDYSTRAADAAACVADDAGTDAFADMHQELFARQPAEGSAGLTDDQLAQLATSAGADEDSVSSCIDGATFEDWVAKATDQASDDGVSGTPTITVDGTQVTPGAVPTLDDVRAAIAAA